MIGALSTTWSWGVILICVAVAIGGGLLVTKLVPDDRPLKDDEDQLLEKYVAATLLLMDEHRARTGHGANQPGFGCQVCDFLLAPGADVSYRSG